ncbi:MAG: FHA domain-containing protein, partial [Planctomycetota bacterium]
RGKVYNNLSLPVSIGREEGNTIQLNDDRVSRYHLKIQLDHENLVLTDLESTNGTRVNGEDTHLKILRFGDIITVGRSTLLVGTREQVLQRIAKLNRPDLEKQLAGAASGERSSSKSTWNLDPNYSLSLLSDEPPQIPNRLSPGQSAQLAELLDYLYLNLRKLIGEGTHKNRGEQVELSLVQWQQLIDVQARVAELLHKLGRG